MARNPTPKAAAIDKAAAPKPGFTEIGVAGLKETSGYVYEEFLPELLGERGRRTLRMMSENDPTIGAALLAVGLVLRAVKWTAQPQKKIEKDEEETDEAKADREFAESLLKDMSHSWEDFLAEALTMLVYGWAYFEIVIKRRVGPDETDPTKRSAYSDGLIGIRKLAPRAQDSLQKWEFDEDGGIAGMWQYLWPEAGQAFLPISRSLLFRTTSRRNNPEGVSIIRNAYRPWYFHSKIQESEAIGIERELAGLPLVRVPNVMLTSTLPEHQASKALYQKIALDVRFNEQGGLVIPSDTYPNPDGSPSAQRIVDIELLSSGGGRAIDTDKVKTGYQRDMARSVLADFLTLGTDKGAFNLAESKTDLFMKACETSINGVAAVLNRHMLPRIWRLNGKDVSTMPVYVPGRLTPVDLAGIADFLQKLGAAGATIFPDEELEDYLREEAELPPKSPEAKAEQDKVVEDEAARVLEQIEAKKPPPGAPPARGAF